MFKIVACVALMLPLLVACEKEHQPAFETGLYKGSFRRTGAGYIGSGIAAVELNFDGKSFSGNSTQQYYPAIGSGKYSVMTDKIIFNNESAFPANFDWSLILDESFSRNLIGDSIVLIKGHGDMIYYHDVYTLKKQ